MPHLLLLAPSGSYRTGDFLAAARRLQVRVTVATDRAPVFQGGPAPEVLRVDFQPPGEGLTQILDYARANPVDAVVATDDRVGELCAAAAKALGCVHAAPAAVAAALDKHRFRQRLVQAGIATPWFRRVSLAGDLGAAAAAAPYPCVLKPLHLCASRGVIRADGPEQFLAACRRIRRILESIDTPMSTRHRRSVLVEAFIPGHEVALDGIMTDGRLKPLALFDKPRPLCGPYFEESLFVTPSRHSPGCQQRIHALAERAARALGLVEGPVHAEARVDGDRIWLLELAARAIGGLCARSLRFAPDMSEETLILRHALGWPVDNFSRETWASGVMMIPIPGAGILRGVTGVAAARAVPGIDDLVITLGPGEALVPLPEGDRYLGFIFASGGAPQDVVESLERAHAALRIERDAC